MKAAAVALAIVLSSVAGPAISQQAASEAPGPVRPDFAAIFREQVIPNWNLAFCDIEGADNLRVRVRTFIGPDGRLTQRPVAADPQASLAWRSASESAIRALNAAQPFDVPAEFQGVMIDFVFDTRAACAG